MMRSRLEETGAVIETGGRWLWLSEVQVVGLAG